ncbi:MAG: cytidylate kinase family protein [Candidatus Uhrbacteria bacterium]|nr:cytidylate kinase family protein [Candidatus Uhrbacteria bacterium]
MIFTISGVPGSGKTSVGKILAKRLGMKFYSMGNLRGKMAIERGLTIAELNTLGETDPITDTTVDEYQKELGEKEDGFIVEGRLSWHFIPHSVKILLLCEPAESARRIFESRRSQNGEQSDEPPYKSVEDARQKLNARLASDHLRYQKHYGIKNYLDATHYDVVLDTTRNERPEQTVEQILSALHNR